MTFLPTASRPPHPPGFYVDELGAALSDARALLTADSGSLDNLLAGYQHQFEKPDRQSLELIVEGLRNLHGEHDLLRGLDRRVRKALDRAWAAARFAQVEQRQ